MEAREFLNRLLYIFFLCTPIEISMYIIARVIISELDIPLKYAQKLYNEFAIRHPNAFYLRTRQRGMQNWDGKIHYITKTSSVSTKAG